MALSNSICEKILDIHIDNRFTYAPHVRSLCKKANEKLNAFAKIACFLKSDQRKLHTITIFLCSSCFDVSRCFMMFFDRKLNNHINCIYERDQDHNSIFDEPFAKDGFCKIHDRHLQKLLNEILKVNVKLAPKMPVSS